MWYRSSVIPSGALTAGVIPSGGPQGRSRGIALLPVEGHSVGTSAIPRLRARFACASLGMTLALAAPLAAQKPDRDYTVLVASEAVDLITRVRFGPGAGP